MRVWLLRLLFVLGAVVPIPSCGGSVGGTTTPVPTRLPTVTPQAARTIPASTALPAATSAPATPLPTPTATPATITTDTGIVTARMAALQLTGEPYATLGDPAAPITVIEFGDHGCPFCRQHALEVLPMIEQDYIATGKVFYVYKDLPVTSTHGDLAAEAAQCAGEQGDFWGMHRALAFDPPAWNGTRDAARTAMRSYAADLGLDTAALDACVDGGRYTAQVQRDVDEALELGIRNTPIFVIDDRVLIGSRPAREFAAILDEALERAR